MWHLEHSLAVVYRRYGGIATALCGFFLHRKREMLDAAGADEQVRGVRRRLQACSDQSRRRHRESVRADAGVCGV